MENLLPRKRLCIFFYITFDCCVLNYLSLQLSPQQEIKVGKGRSSARSFYRSGSVMGQSVLVVRAGNSAVKNLLQPVKLIFKHNLQQVTRRNISSCCNWKRNLLCGHLYCLSRYVFQLEDATCVFWQDSDQMEGRGGVRTGLLVVSSFLKKKMNSVLFMMCFF